jgi:uncharacterized HAD superfamily protein
MLNSPILFGNLPLIKGIDTLIPYFNSQDLYIITSRHRAVQDATKKRVAEVGLKPQMIIFRSNKTKTVRDYNIDVFVDDQVKCVEPLPKEQVVLMPDMGYNREFVKRAMYEGRMVFPYEDSEQLYNYLIKLQGVTHDMA